MALASVFRTFTTTSLQSVSSAQTILQEINQLFLDAGLVRTADTGQADLNALPAGVIPSTASNSQWGQAITLLYELNDSWSSEDPVILKFQFFIHKNGQASSPCGLFCIVYVMFATDGAGNPVGTSSSYASYANVSGSSGATYDLRPNTSAARAFVYKEDGRLSIGLYLGGWIPSATANSPTALEYSTLYMTLRRAKDQNGDVTPGTVHWLMPPSMANQGGGATWANIDQMSAAEERGNRVNGAALRDGYVVSPDPVCRWMGGSTAQDAQSQLQVQPSVICDAGILYPIDDLIMFWSPTGRGGGPATGTDFTVNDGVNDYTYVSLGSKTVAVESIAGNQNVGFAMKLGLVP